MTQPLSGEERKEEGSSVADIAASVASQPDCSTAQHSAGWRDISSAPTRGVFLAVDERWEYRKCWRHKPSSRTDEILTWKRNGRFKATHWMPLPPPPEDTAPSCRALPREDGSVRDALNPLLSGEERKEEGGTSRHTLNRGFRYRLEPTAEQAQAFEQFAGVCRLVYNLALEQRRDWWRQYKANEGRSISFASQCREVTALRSEYDWIAAVPTDATTYALRDLERAYANFFAGRSEYPTPRRKGDRDGFRIKGRETRARPLNAKWAEVRVPKIGWVKMRLTRPLRGDIRNVQVIREGDHWFASLSCEWEQEDGVPLAAQVGIDRGVARTVTLSTGEHFQVPDTARLLAQRKRAQRVLARRKKGSSRYYAQRRRVAAIASKVARIRTDWCHRTSTEIARRHGLVAIEALNIKGMTASAAGTVDEPGRGVAQKRGLNRSILEQCWGKFARHLDYKLAERGGVLIAVPAHFTSQTCAVCGVVDARSRESQAVFRCVACGHEDNADINAAKEILRRSTSGLDVEARVAGPSKRQPQESAHA